MSARQFGFGGMQMVIAIAVMAVVTIIAVPKYNAYVTKSKITEAFNLAGVSKHKLAEFYMLNGRFPRTQSEAEAMKTTTLSPPKYVKDLVVIPNFESHDVAVKVSLKDGVVDNQSGGEQFIFISGDSSGDSQNAVQWGCGSQGIPDDLLPANCKG